MKTIQTDFDLDYVVKHGRKFKHNDEVKASDVVALIKPEHIKSAVAIALRSKMKVK